MRRPKIARIRPTPMLSGEESRLARADNSFEGKRVAKGELTRPIEPDNVQ